MHTNIATALLDEIKVSIFELIDLNVHVVGVLDLFVMILTEQVYLSVTYAYGNKSFSALSRVI